MAAPIRAGLNALAVVMVLGATSAHSQTLSQEELSRIVREQAVEIAALKARLGELEGSAEQGVTPVPPSLAGQPQTAAVPASPATDPPRSDASIEWGKGAPTFTSADGKFSFKLRGRIIVDASTTGGSRHQERNLTTTGTRALRLGVEGTVGPHFFYQLEADFAENEVDVVTAFMGWEAKLGKLGYDVRIGNLFNDRGFEGSTGSNAAPFLERSIVATAIRPERGFYGLGGQVRLFGPDWHASVTLTGEDVDSDASASDTRVLLARAHWNPLKTDRAIIHLGLWVFDEKLSGSIGDIARDTDIGGRFNDNLAISSGPLAGSTGDIGYGAEVGGFFGPAWMMGEWGQRKVRLMLQPDFEANAWSVSGGWFLTGERPPYNARLGNFAFPTVRRPITDGGLGALELTARYEKLDHRDAPLGGEGRAATIGLNWFLADFVRLMFNGIFWRTDNRNGPFTGPDDGRTFSLRAQVSF